MPMFCRTKVLNPGKEAESSYVPTGRLEIVKLPVSEVPISYVELVAVFFAWIDTPGITAPVASDTVPVIVPPVCPNAARAAHRHRAIERKALFISRLLFIAAKAAAPSLPSYLLNTLRTVTVNWNFPDKEFIAKYFQN